MGPQIFSLGTDLLRSADLDLNRAYSWIVFQLYVSRLCPFCCMCSECQSVEIQEQRCQEAVFFLIFNISHGLCEQYIVGQLA